MHTIRDWYERFRRSSRARRWLAAALVVVGFASLVAGIANGFIRTNVYETQPFADNALEAFRDESVQALVAEKLTEQLVIRLPSFARDAEPLLGVLVLQAVQTRQFERAFREAAVDANRVFFSKDSGNPALDLSYAGPIIESIALTVDPRLAQALPDTVEGLLVEVSSKPAVNQAVRIAEDSRDATFLFPSLAIVLFALGIVVATDRRRAVVWVGVLVAVSGLALWIGSEALRTFVLSERTGSTVDDATRATVDAYVSDAPWWGFVLTLAGAILAAAAVSVARPVELSERLRRGLRLATSRPQSAGLALLRALVIGAVGAFVVFQRDLAVSIVAIAAGFVLLLVCLTEIMRLAQRARPGAGELLPWLVAFVSVIGLVAAGVVVLS